MGGSRLPRRALGGKRGSRWGQQPGTRGGAEPSCPHWSHYTVGLFWGRANTGEWDRVGAAARAAPCPAGPLRCTQLPFACTLGATQPQISAVGSPPKQEWTGQPQTPLTWTERVSTLSGHCGWQRCPRTCWLLAVFAQCPRQGECSLGQWLSWQGDELATGWGWESEEPTLKSESTEIPASGHSCFTRCQKASKGGRRESGIGCFCNPFLQEAQQPSGPERAAAHPLLGGLGEPRPPHRAPGQGVPQLLPLFRAGRSRSGDPGVAEGAGELLGLSHSCCRVY